MCKMRASTSGCLVGGPHRQNYLAHNVFEGPAIPERKSATKLDAIKHGKRSRGSNPDFLRAQEATMLPPGKLDGVAHYRQAVVFIHVCLWLFKSERSSHVPGLRNRMKGCECNTNSCKHNFCCARLLRVAAFDVWKQLRGWSTATAALLQHCWSREKQKNTIPSPRLSRAFFNVPGT